MQRGRVGKTWRIGHETSRRSRFREGNDVTDVIGTGQQHDQTIQTKRQARMWRGAKFQRIQQEAKLLTLFILSDAQNTKDRLLHFSAMNTHRTPPTS